MRGSEQPLRVEEAARLSEGPNFPGGVATGVDCCLPANYRDGISGDWLDGFAQQLADFVIGRRCGQAYVRGLKGDDQPVTAIADYLDGVRRRCRARRPVAVVPQMGCNEDEEKNQRHHHVVVEVTARIGPEEIAFYNLVHDALTL